MKHADLDIGRTPVPLGLSVAASVARQRAADFITLTKPRLNFLVVVTAMVGYYLGTGGRFDVLTLV